MKTNGFALLTAMVVFGSSTVLYLGADDKKPVVKTGSATASKPAGTKSSTSKKPKKVVKTEAQWKKILTPEQFLITRKAGTERAFGAAYAKFKKQGEGTYFCVCCGAELFTSKQKFNSGCGWPSFYDPSKAPNITEKRDTSLGAVRTEVVCTVCDAHLGHVFFGEGFNTPTDKRYCINGAAMRFEAKGAKKKPEGSKKGAVSKSGKKKKSD